MQKQLERGDIFYIGKEDYQQVGCEMQPGRPGVIVSNNANNHSSKTVEVVYTTTRTKTELPTHVIINSTPRQSTVLCEQITTIAVERLGNYIGKCTDDEMAQIEKSLRTSLGLHEGSDAIKHAAPVQEPDKKAESDIAPKAELKTYKALYENLLNRVVGRSG